MSASRGSLKQRLLGCVREDLRRQLVTADLERLLANHLDSATGAWPALAVPVDRYLAHLGQRLPDDGPFAALETLRAADLYLACACASGDEKAIALLESQHFGDIDTALARRGFSRAQADEVKQILRKQLFVADADGRPKIAEFGGRGPLGAWLRVSAVRAGLKLIRKERHETPVDDERLLEASAGSSDPELEFMKMRYH